MHGVHSFNLDDDPVERRFFRAVKYNNPSILLKFLGDDDNNLRYINEPDAHGFTALHLAATHGSHECLKIILDQRADPNKKQKSTGRTALHFAVEKENEKVVKTLLDYGADPNANDLKNITPMDIAEDNDMTEIVVLLHDQQGAMKREQEALKASFGDAVLNNDIKTAEAIAEQIHGIAEVIHSYHGGVPSLLYRVCEAGHYGMVNLLLKFPGVDLCCTDVASRWTPLHVACQLKSAEAKELITTLIKKEPKTVNMVTSDGLLPLHIAAEYGTPDIVETILNFPYDESRIRMETYKNKDKFQFSLPFDVNLKDKQNRTPLYCACCAGKRENVRMMIEFMVMASRFEHACEYSEDLEQNESEVLMRHNRSFYQNVQEICPFDANCNGHSPLFEVIKNHSAAEPDSAGEEYLAIVEMLLKLGVDANKETVEEDCSKSPLSLASENCDLRVMDLLLKYGACDIDQEVLTRAAFISHHQMIAILLKYSTYQDTRNKINQIKMRRDADVPDDLLSCDSQFRSKFPTKAVSINWQGLLPKLDEMNEQWLTVACLHHNDHLDARIEFLFYSITQVDISKNSLTELPPEVFHLQSLRILNASWNRLKCLPEQLYKYPEVLEELQIQRNEISQLPVWLFHKQVSKLSRLNAANNNIIELPKEIWSAPKLTEVILANNKLSELPMIYLGNCPSKLPSIGSRRNSRQSSEDSGILQLQISIDSSIDEGDGILIENCSDIAVVQNCTESQMTSYAIWEKKIPNLDDSLDGPIGDEEFVESHIKELNLANNCFKTIPRNLPCVVPKLSKLNMSGNFLLEIGWPRDYPKNLKVLNLSNNSLTGLSKDPDSDLDSEYYCHTQLYSSTKGGTGKRVHTAVGRESSVPFSVCFHRHHEQFLNLHTLYLGNNMLVQLMLSHNRSRKESDTSITDGNSVKARSGTTPPGNTEKTETKRLSGVLFPQSLTDDRLMRRRSLLYPFLSTLDVSSNKLQTIPEEVAEMDNLTQLILKKNVIKTLPSQLGNLSKLWNLDLSGCPLEGHLRTLQEKNASAMDLLGYLKSQQDKMVEYNCLKLMVVGVECIGKSLMLKNLRKHENNPSVEPKTRSQRLGQVDNRPKKAKYIPTEGVDIQDLTMKRKGQEIKFKTWDFGGKREYYATHQYFLSKRALYLVVWNMEDGEKGINGLHQWLVNIQARAPDSHVIIVGTHLDHMKRSEFPRDYIEDCCKKLDDRFVTISEKSTQGLPNVLCHVEISNRSMFNSNIGVLADLVFKEASSLKDTSTKRAVVKQEVPYRYVQLEKVVIELAKEKRVKKEAPVLTTKHYNYEAMEKMRLMNQQTFNSQNELEQATQFLHENGVLLHYEDPILQDLFFLDPQWLCDMLTSVLENEDESTPMNGQIRIGELKHRFRNSPYKHKEVEEYILNLMNKFELGLQYDDENLIIPQLLPTEKQLREKQHNIKEVWIPLKKPKPSPKHKLSRHSSDTGVYRSSQDRGSASDVLGIESPSSTYSYTGDSTASVVSVESRLSGPDVRCASPSTSQDDRTSQRSSAADRDKCRSMFYIPTPKNTPPESPAVTRVRGVPPTLHPGSITLEIKPEVETLKSLRRLYLMSYFPSGFWARLITRLLAEQSMYQTVLNMYPSPPEVLEDPSVASLISQPEWLCYQTGIELVYMNSHILMVREITEETLDLPCDYRQCSLLLQQEGKWSPIKKLESLSILEVFLPNNTMDLKFTDKDSSVSSEAEPTEFQAVCNRRAATKLLATVISHIDNLLEDWYPDIGLRFAQNVEGMYLITRIVPCAQCFIHQIELQTNVSSEDEESWGQVFVRNGLASVIKSVTVETEAKLLQSEQLPNLSILQKPDDDNAMYCFTIEECMLATQRQQTMVCGKHRQISSPAANNTELHIAPDIVFADLDPHQLISQHDITRNKYLGRGAFSSVFKGIYRSHNRTEGVAIKVLEPVKPGNEASSDDMENYKQVQKKWKQDPLRGACKSYLIARQECGIMFTLSHKHIVQLLGISLQPLSLILEVAPLGELYTKLKEYKKNNARLPVYAIKKIILQTASALHYLHNHKIIHRDLKSDNVMVWNMPPPHNTDPTQPVDVKLADYGISRAVLPTGGKGYAGTPGFVAPEVIQFMGEESYTEKVDCFSYGMLIYELLTLHRPLEDQLSNAANWKSIILNNERPVLRKSDTDLYPTHFLDLMVMCWEQDPTHRPTADDIIAVASTPEFCHLRHAVSPDVHHDVTCAVSIRTPEPIGIDTQLVLNMEEPIPKTDVWLSFGYHVSTMMEIVTYENETPVETKSVKLKQPSSIMVMCPIGDYMWCADHRGYIITISQKTFEEVLCINVSGSTITGTCVVKGILYIQDFDKVLVVLSNGRMKVCDNTPSCEEELNIQEYYGNGKSIHCATLVSANNCDEIWCGQDESMVLVWEFRQLNKQPRVIHHYEPSSSDRKTWIFAKSPQDKKSLWSYVFPGTYVFHWDSSKRTVLGSLDCSRVIPHAERHQRQLCQSGRLPATKCQVTAMNVVNNELYIGTTWGCVIVVDKNTMHHITSFRCHEQNDIYVNSILPLNLEEPKPCLDPKLTQCRVCEEKSEKNIVTVGKGYRNMMKTLCSATSTTIRRQSLEDRTFLLSFSAEHWKYY